MRDQSVVRVWIKARRGTRIASLLGGAYALAPAAIAQAQDFRLDPSVDVRARYEHVDQDGLPRAGDALTIRVRPSITATIDRWSALLEAEAVIAPVDRYNDGLNGRPGYPTIADPENLDLNRAQIAYTVPGFAATVGRQWLAFADERFVGTAPWRQSDQTFDALRLKIGKPAGLSADIAYSWSVRTVNGRDGFGARPAAIGGDNLFGLVQYATTEATIAGFAYLVDHDAAAVQGFRLSSQTYGARLTGTKRIGEAAQLGYAATWARQRDYARNPNRYSAGYWLGEASLAVGGASALAGAEVLGADRGLPLTSVQVPLGAAFKFNGWAGRFVPTPPDGLRDVYATLGYTLPRVGALGTLAVSASWHDFTSDRVRRHYGNEIDLLVTVKRGPHVIGVRIAHYVADGFATDTDKFWLQFDTRL